jgi:hypothetical protein
LQRLLESVAPTSNTDTDDAAITSDTEIVIAIAVTSGNSLSQMIDMILSS